MAFESLTDKLQDVFKDLRSKGRLTEADVKVALKEVKMALLEADVNFKVVKQFVKSVEELRDTMKLRHLFFACSGVFVMMFSLLLLVVIVFSDEEDGGSGGNLIYGGVSVSQEVLAHKPMLEKYAREYGIEEYLNVLLAIIQVESILDINPFTGTASLFMKYDSF